MRRALARIASDDTLPLPDRYNNQTLQAIMVEDYPGPQVRRKEHRGQTLKTGAAPEVLDPWIIEDEVAVMDCLRLNAADELQNFEVLEADQGAQVPVYFSLLCSFRRLLEK
jgi:hypothetical protein